MGYDVRLELVHEVLSRCGGMAALNDLQSPERYRKQRRRRTVVNRTCNRHVMKRVFLIPRFPDTPEQR